MNRSVWPNVWRLWGSLRTQVTSAQIQIALVCLTAFEAHNRYTRWRKGRWIGRGKFRCASGCIHDEIDFDMA